MKNRKICLVIMIVGVLVIALGIFLTFKNEKIRDNLEEEKPTIGDPTIVLRSEALEVVKNLYEDTVFYVKDAGKKNKGYYIFERLNRETDQMIAEVYVNQETGDIKIRSVSISSGGESE